jgi:small-conductance mechanosensitive channel
MLTRLLRTSGLLLLWLPAAFAQANAPVVPNAPTPATGEVPVIFENKPLFSLGTRVGSFSPADRARAVSERLGNLSRDPLAHIGSLAVVDGGTTSDILAGDVVIMSVTDADAQAAGQNRKQLAAEYALRESRREHGLRSTVVAILLAILATAMLAVLLRLSGAGFRRLFRTLDAWRETRIRSIRIQRVELLSAERIGRLLLHAVKGLRIAVALVLFYAYFLLVLSFFPWTRGVSATLIDYLRSGAGLVLSTVASDLPNIVMIAIIAVITRYVIKFCKFIFAEIGRDTIAIPGFYAEWADPTYKIARFLILAFAAVVMFPYFPGHDSPAFKGISIFVGVLFSLGSAGAVGNIIAGVLLTYTRAFQIGDRVRISDTVGDVLGKTLLATRIRTIKNEDVTVPNSLVLGSHIVNFSACAADNGLILHTSVTIGYDAPWRRVHELLIASALSTQGILRTPLPFVLQTSLNDFYVAYEINAYTNEPTRMAAIYAEIHQNIQDKFNEAGVEICSPHFAAVRDANHIAIPPVYVSEGYVAPAFRVRAVNGDKPTATAHEA